MPRDLNGRQSTLIHLNGNLLCSVDVKTTGPDCNFHEIYEVGIIAIDSFFERRRDRLPLDLLIQPSYPERIDKNYLEKRNLTTAIERAKTGGLPHPTALKLFERWFTDLELSFRKKVAPIGFDYGHESRFLRQWLGELNYREYFDDSNIRDIRVLSKVINDLADFRQTPYIFVSGNFSELAHKMKVYTDYGRVRSALHDAAITADIYKAMLAHIRGEMMLI